MSKSQKQVIILTDIPKWVEGLNAALQSRDISVDLVDLTKMAWVPSEKLAWSDCLIINRLSANTGGGVVAALTKARDILASLELAGARLVNGLHCQLVSSSKALQAAIFYQAGVKTPRTELLEPGNTPDIGDGVKLVKPNVSGFGKGITVASVQSDLSYSQDGCAILQKHLSSADGKVHRVELLGGRVLYRSSVPLMEYRYDYCLGDMEQAELYSDCPVKIGQACERIARLAKMDVGSVEYLLDEEGQAWFIDINPVSTYSPEVRKDLGFSPHEKLADFLAERICTC